MSSADKMIHLKSLFTGERKALVDGYVCYGDLCTAGLSRLQEHFGNSKRVVNASHEKFVELCFIYDQDFIINKNIV